MNTLFQENKTAILFIVKFAGLYLVLNTLYGFFVSWYLPSADPVTILISEQVATILSFFSNADILAVTDPASARVALQQDFLTVVKVYEGCNGVNVVIVYVSFLIAFKGPFKSAIIFMIMGILLIYVMNLLRVGLLFEVAYYYPERLYFFHKYFFTGIIYMVVFGIWYFWMKHVRAHH